ncbi:MAG: SgcJ/EcaC family oxidoreductase [Myxococcales bacterium]
MDHPAMVDAVDAAALKAAFERMVEAWNAGSAEDFAAAFSDDADFVAFEGSHLRSRASIAAFHRHVFEHQMRGSHLQGDVEFVRSLGTDLAILYGRVRVTFAGQTRPSPSRDAVQLFVARRGPEGFRFEAVLNARIVPLERQRWWDQLEALPEGIRRNVTDHVEQVAHDRDTGPSKFLRVAALVLAGLSLTMTSAHVLEMSPKMDLEPWLYSVVNASLYRWFVAVGGVYGVLALVAVWGLVVSARKVPAIFHKATVAAVLLSAAFLSWLVLVLPVNRAVAWMAGKDPALLPVLWAALRPRWEYGHVIGFVLGLLGFCTLAAAVVGDAWNSRRRSISDLGHSGGVVI